MPISLIIRTFNEEKNIEKCLSCVEKQTIRPNEVLVVDNISTDKTVEIVEEYKKRSSLNVTVITNKARSYSSGLNLGFENSACDLICFLSADCFPRENWLEELILTMNSNNCDVVQGREVYFPENDFHFVLEKEKPKKNYDYRVSFFNNTNVLYRKDVLRQYLPFQDVIDCVGAEDTIMSIRYIREKRRAFVSHLSIVYHDHISSVDDLKRLSVRNGRLSRVMVRKHFFYPRTYLNLFYWSMIDLCYFFRYGDKRFIKFFCIRLGYGIKGIFGFSFIELSKR